MDMLKNIRRSVGFILICVLIQPFSAQNSNCFLDDFQPKPAKIPTSVLVNKITSAPTVNVTLTADTITQISKYIFGNALAVWMGNVTDDPTFVDNTKTLAPTLIRFPGGSWSDIFFWNGRPTDIPDSLYDGITGKKTKFYAISGKGDWSTTLDNYYTLRQQVGTQGLITINYAYARYGTSANPVATAAHLAADWVRYDKGRTRFWEIGNESAGPWEAGFMIDTKTNKDGQPSIITGQIYAQHFNVIADSMRQAAAQVGAKIFIGGQIMHFDGSTSWNPVDATWNADFFRIAANSADYYVMHNYFGSAATVDHLLSVAQTEPKKNIDFIRQDIADKKAASKPIALTEYNMHWDFKEMGTSVINGMQAVILFNELIKNKFGLSARWLLATGETGMFYQGGDNSLLWQPRPEFYYAYFQQLFTGDHMISANSTHPDVLTYSTRFSTGETGFVIVNRSKLAKVVNVKPKNIGVGSKYYVYSLDGGAGNGDFSQIVYVNGIGPTGTQWGPREKLTKIPANAYTITDSIKVQSPPLSVQFVMIDKGTNILNPTSVHALTIDQNFISYPNPFKNTTIIEFCTHTNDEVRVDIYNSIGTKVTTLINQVLPFGTHKLELNAEKLPVGFYVCRLHFGDNYFTRKIQKY